MKKTISDLNERWWYRLIKVFYICLILLGSFLCLVVTHDYLGGFGTIDDKATKIVCDPDKAGVWPDAPSDLTLHTVGIETPPPYFFEGGHLNFKAYFSLFGISLPNTENNLLKIFAACSEGDYASSDGNKPDLYLLQRMFELTAVNGIASSTMGFTEEQLEDLYQIANAEFDFEKEKYLMYSPRPFDIVPSYKFLPYLKYSFFSLAIFLLVLEAFRRVFYYIVLGSVSPEKSE